MDFNKFIIKIPLHNNKEIINQFKQFLENTTTTINLTRIDYIRGLN